MLQHYFDVLVRPKRTFQTLPSNEILSVSWILPLYFGFSRFLRESNVRFGVDKFGSELVYFSLAFVFSIIMIPVGALILKLVVRAFGKRISFRKAMNIRGCAQLPRVYGILVAGVIFYFAPSVYLLDGDLNIVSGSMIAVTFAGLLYSVFLVFYGLVVTPDDTPLKIDTRETQGA